jgi:hypothetical protein
MIAMQQTSEFLENSEVWSCNPFHSLRSGRERVSITF